MYREWQMGIYGLNRYPKTDAERQKITMDEIAAYRHEKNCMANWNPAHTSIKSCLKAGFFAEVIARVNDNVENDFTTYSGHVVKCPSVLIAQKFKFSLNSFLSLDTKEKSSYNDLLYAYRKLKEKGLNEPVIDAYSKKQTWSVRDVFSQMDRLLEIPEEERFKTPVAPRVVSHQNTVGDANRENQNIHE